MSERRIYWEPLVSSGAVIATILGVVLPLFIHIDNRTDAKIEAIRQDIRDFHGRLEKQDAEFKAFMRQQEEKRRTG